MKRLLVYYDGNCRYCRASARTIRRLDWFGWVDTVSFRHGGSFVRFGITPEALEQAMHVVVPGRPEPVVRAGYPAVVTVVRYLPVLWPLLPLAWLAGWLGLGQRVYRWLAEHRVIVPDPERCRDSVCELPPRQ